MPLLSVIKNYADNTVLTQQQLNQAFDSIETFLNNTKLDSQNIQASAITSTELAANAVTTDKINDASITLDKLAIEVFNRLQPAGTIIASGATVTPQGYLYCNGAAVSRTVFSDLFNAMGTAFGNGDNVTTFNVPDLRGQFLRGQDDATGQDPDASSRFAPLGGNVGDAVGSYQTNVYESHNHSQNAHTHSLSPHVHNVGLSNGSPGGILAIQPTLTAALVSVPGLTGNGTDGISGTTATNNASGGNETRPDNAYVRHYIKT